MITNYTSKDKQIIFKEIEEYLKSLNFSVVQKDFNRPWGGFFVIDERQAPQFAATFFPHINFSDIQAGKWSPKFLVVEPSKRLSWQYHHRRSEIWRLVEGKAGVVTSFTDEEGTLKPLQLDETIQLSQGERHRLVGLDTWGIVAEIWRHTDASKPSDEEDIVRLQDDFGR